MTRHWIFQANPDVFDIDAALLELEELWWRVPQYTSEVRQGDLALVWRSGDEAGVIAIGRILDDPSHCVQPERERRFQIDGQFVETTRCTVALRSVPLVPKHHVQAMPSMATHQIVVSPRATVYPLDGEQWAALTAGMPPPPDARSITFDRTRPTPFAWDQRRKSVYPMPGGYTEYLDSLHTVLDFVSTEMPAPDRFVEWMRSAYGLGEIGARNRANFLRRAGWMREEGGVLRATESGRRWLEDQDHEALVAEMHARIQFIGEMLRALYTPRSAAELLEIANDDYGMGWNTAAQISRRRGWLQSAGFITVDADGLLVATDEGRVLAGELSLHTPRPAGSDETPSPRAPASSSELAPVEQPVVAPSSELDEILRRLDRGARDSQHPQELELAVRDAFVHLGFRAEHIAGPGNTDVVADADLGRGLSYRVNIDTKATASGVVTDNQINWDSLSDHRDRNRADFVVVVGVGFAGGNLLSRAEQRGFKLLTVAELAGLCRQHSATPLGIDDYRTLFEVEGTALGIDMLSERVDEVERLLSLTTAVLAQLDDMVTRGGPVGARELFFVLGDRAPDLEVEVDDIQEVLDALASPLIGALRPVDDRFVPTGPPATLSTRLRRLAELVEQPPTA